MTPRRAAQRAAEDGHVPFLNHDWYKPFMTIRISLLDNGIEILNDENRFVLDGLF